MTGIVQCVILLACIIYLCETLYGRSHYQLIFFYFSGHLLNSFFPLRTSLTFYVPVILQTTNTSTFLFFFSKQNELLVNSQYNWEESLPHTNSFILSFKSKNNDFWMSPRTFKGKHPFYNGDIAIFYIWPVRIRLSLFT